MHLQFLIEDTSGEILIHKVMEKLRNEGARFTYDCKAFRGIGGFKGSGKASDIKTNRLLNDLTIYLRGFDKSFRNYNACIFVILDNDKRDIEKFKQELEYHAALAMVSVDYTFCVAIEEIEAWLLGDEEALFNAYPNARESKYREYRQDSICGTWEFLADVVFKGGITKFKKECPTYREVGKYKAEWAEKIGENMKLDGNKSPSFQFFIREVRKKVRIA